MRISKTNNPVIYLGRSTRLHDHLLWLVGSITRAELAHWEQGHIDHTDVNFDHFNSELAPKILSNLIQLSAEHKLSHNSEKYWFDSSEIVSIDPSIQLSGVQAASKIGLDKGFIEINRQVSPPLYKLTKSGYPVGINHLVQNREVGDKKMLISFARFNPGQLTNLFRYFNKIEPHDSNLFIFGKIDDDLNCSGVYSFSEVLEDESLGKIHDETETCLQQINSKSEIEEFNALEPILVINPNREKLEFSFHSKIMNHILEYEIEHGNHKWTFDITSNLSSFSYLVSELSIAAESKISYVLKSKQGVGASGVKVDDSPFTLADHVIDVPSSIAVKALQNLNDTSINFLLVLLHHEQTGKKEEFDLNDLEKILSAESGSNELHRGLTKQEADLRASELSLSIGQSFELGAHPTRVTEKLNLNQLIMRTNDVNPARWTLTDLGEFVAYWAYTKRGLEW